MFANAPTRGRAASLWAGLLIGALLFVPGALGYLYEASSFAPGTSFIGILALALAATGNIPLTSTDIQTAFAAAGVTTLVLLIHLLLATAIGNDPSLDVSRAFLSIILLGLIIVSVPAVREGVMGEDTRITAAIRIVCTLFALSAIFSLAQIQPETASLGAKPIFPYTEPSFLGFSLPAALIFTMLRAPRLVRLVIVLTFFALGYGLGNFTIIVACVLAAATALPLSWLVAGLIVGVIGSASLDLSYYAERLDFNWATSTNLSALVYVQGWQMLGESLHKSLGWGIGFQQLGIVYTNVPASIRINLLLGRDANLQDGGFIMSKIGSELGLLGMLLIVAYFYTAVRSFLRLRTIAKPGVKITDAELFARACVVGYLVEMAVRGTNYFTGTFMLLLAALSYLVRRRVASGARPATRAAGQPA
ncbi:hypothetical protein [Sphingomonas phyllosphaerae]|uniref:hypothetical protein n=1 Tax=Sphingomonas phyllosphaerae TaxID=257003 RepID=UPI0012DF87CD|nr:hypothetical protein [Sphingomonas phyllosphaerae]